MNVKYCKDKYGFKWVAVNYGPTTWFPFLDIEHDSHAIAGYDNLGHEMLLYSSDFKGCKSFMLEKIQSQGSTKTYYNGKLHIVKLTSKVKRYWSKYPGFNTMYTPKFIEESYAL